MLEFFTKFSLVDALGQIYDLQANHIITGRNIHGNKFQKKEHPENTLPKYLKKLNRRRK